MKFRRIPGGCLAAILVFALWQMMSYPLTSVSADDNTAVRLFAPQDSIDNITKDARSDSNKLCSTEPKNRADSVRALVSYLGLGEGSTVADIGAGGGQDTWVFAEIVGEKGTVFSEEIVENMVKSLKTEAEKKGLGQVSAVLGRSDDPCLPPNSVELVFLYHVYHHFAKPREMLRGIWRTLRPGGHLAVVDRHRGTLRDWVPRHLREQKHFWIAETTVVREAREEGFAFVACAEQCWHEKDHFVLIFQRPKGLASPGRDPDLFRPIPINKCAHLFLPINRPYQHPVFVALGQARELIAPILKSSSDKGLEIVLEEWATQKEERPLLPSDVSLPSVLTEKGDSNLGAEPIDVVFFLDSYHLLFHGRTLLSKIYEKLSPTGCIYILDRKAEKLLSRREASHCRKIHPETVKQEMTEAGFFLWFRGPRLARDRFLLVFGKDRPTKVSLEDNLFVGGPVIPEPPGGWLKKNYWRLLGLKTDDGRFIPFKEPGRKVTMEKVPSGSSDKEFWKIPKENLILHLDKKAEEYLLTDYRFLDGQ